MLDFNIFNLAKETDSNELITVVTHILAKENIFDSLNLKFDSFMRFITKISQGYKTNVSYHSKTHGADLS